MDVDEDANEERGIERASGTLNEMKDEGKCKMRRWTGLVPPLINCLCDLR